MITRKYRSVQLLILLIGFFAFVQQIKLDKATKWAQGWGPDWDVRFSQVNSPDGINVDDPFYNAVQTFLEKKQQRRR